MIRVAYRHFEWDAHKGISNFAKHGVRFVDAAMAMSDPYAVDFDDSSTPST